VVEGSRVAIANEIRDVKIPQELQDAMARVATADREKMARVKLAESESLAADKMLEAAKVEGHKEAERSFHYANEVEKIHAQLYQKLLRAFLVVAVVIGVFSRCYSRGESQYHGDWDGDVRRHEYRSWDASRQIHQDIPVE
jgi:regulator of protease activity HflC (stomatin/prohibitin superfamily)